MELAQPAIPPVSTPRTRASSALSGYVELFCQDEHGCRVLARGRNNVQYEGYDALAKLVSGQIGGRINAIYFQFDYNGPGTSRAPVGYDYKAADFRNLSGDLDFLRVQLPVGTLDSTAAEYASNRVLFSGIAAAGDVGAAQGLAFGSGSAIELVALAIAPVWADASQDLVYAAFAPASPLALPASGAIGMRYRVFFEAP